MAAGEGRTNALRCEYLRSPLVSLWVQKDHFSAPDENLADLSDAYSDSGSERDENSRNVVRWLESLPADHQWYEAEEQIGRPESSEAVFHDGISTIGDTDAPITLRRLKRPDEPREADIEASKVSRDRKYRKGTLRASSTTKERPERKKKSPSRERRASPSKKSCVPKAVFHDGISTDAPITLKSLKKPDEPRSVGSDASEVSRRRRYRKGSLDANSMTKDHPERKKKSLSRERRATSSKKSCASTAKDFTPSAQETRESRRASTACRPNFRRPEFGKFLDEAMSLAIRKYKRNERTWESSNAAAGTSEPPAKKSKAAENVEKK